VGVLDRVNARARRGRGDEQRYSIDTWISDYLIPSGGQFTYGNTTYPFGLGPSQTLAGNRAAEIANSLPGYRAALQACPPAFAAQMVRALVLSQARFTFRNPPWHRATPRRTFGNSDLAALERPWKNGTTGELVSRCEWHAGLAGNAFVLRRPDRLRVLRPDWTAIIYGSQSEPDWPTGALDAELIGYVYANRGVGTGEPHFLQPSDVAHWSPLPDPEMTGLGMSWLTPAIREMQGDRLASEHKIRFFEQGATPNLVIKGIPAVSLEQFRELVEDMEERHAGVANAYRTLYLTAGADATVIGSNLAELDLKAVQGTNETRLSVLSRVPAALLGISEGLSGSSLNEGNFTASRRNFADTWVYPTLQDLAASLAAVVKVPADAELWFDPADMPILREDAKDAADIEAIKATTITAYVKEGFTPESAIAAVRGQDITLLKHTGLVSVQLWEPGAESPRKPEPGAESPSQPTGAGVPVPPAAPKDGKAPAAANGAGGTGNG
jgi:phage portal protein BeeE